MQAKEAMDRVTSSSAAGKSLASMSSAKRVEVRNELASSLQKNVKSIKNTVLGVRCSMLLFVVFRCVIVVVLYRLNTKKFAKTQC